MERKISPLVFVVLSMVLLAACGGSTPAETPVPMEPTEEPVLAIEPTSAPAETSEQPAPQTGGQWNPDPSQNITVSNLGGDQAIPKIVTGGNGEFYVAWFSNPKIQNYNVRMQKYDAQGNAQWGENGRLVSDNKSDTWITDYAFTTDAKGNPLLIFQDSRTGNNNIFAYNISPDGEMLWGDNGLQVTDNDAFVAPFGTTVMTPEHVTLIWLGDIGNDQSKLFLQKLTPAGEKVWGEDGLIVPGQDDVGFEQGAIASGGDDQIILVYGIENGNTQVMTIYAQKLDGAGNPLWNGGEGIKLHESVPFYIKPQILSDEAGGAFISWYSTDLKSFVQHLDADGQLLMAEGGQLVSPASPNLDIDPRMQFSPEKNELYAFWVDTNELQSMRGLAGQKLSPTDELLWGDNGRSFVDISRAEFGSVTPRLTGDNVVVFYDQGEASETENIQGAQLKAILVDIDGNQVWEQPTVLSSSMSSKSDLEVAEIQAQDWVAVWADQSNDSDDGSKEILMQNLQLSTPAQLPNPASVNCEEQGGTLDIRTDESGGQYGVCVFNDGSECEEWALFRGECKPGV